jgi:hypothetical protein
MPVVRCLKSLCEARPVDEFKKGESYMGNTEAVPSASRVGAQWAELRTQSRGMVITPNDPHYDETRKAWNLSVDQHPAGIVVAEGAEDIMAAMQFAVREDLGVAVQATGHGVVRPADEALLIVTSRMKEVQVDTRSETAWVEAGAIWADVLVKAQAVGLAPLLGSSPGVGAVGYTLGGGFGWLGRRYGLSTDSVRFFELVTADGQMRRASEMENSDLFWGMRGGGSSLAVVTGMEIQLYPVSTVYGGNLFYPIQAAKDVYRRYRDWIASAPEELTSSIVLMNFPPLPMVPEFLRGQSFVIVRGCYCGPVQEGEALLQSWREWQAPVIDDFKVMPFSEVATISNDPVDPMPGRSTGAWLSELSDEAIDVLIQHCAAGEGACPLIATEVRNAGGAVARVHADANAYGNRDATLLLQMIGMAPTLEAYHSLGRYTDQVKERLQPYLTGGVYMNFLEGEESQQRARYGFSPEAYQRLQALKAKYDPDNRLRYGFQIASVH